MFICKRCGYDFSEKKGLVKHLNRKNICMPIESDLTPNELLIELNEKKGLQCNKCNNIYKNKNSLNAHKCKAVSSINNLEGLKKELEYKWEEKFKTQLETQTKLEKRIKELEKQPNSITNNITNIDNSITNNINVTLNCFMDSSGKPIEYLLNSEDIVQKVLGWVKSKSGILEYIDEKFYNPDHPENQMIKKGKNDDSIQLHISGKWKQLNNVKAGDLILTNVGNDFMVYMDTIKEDEDNYKENRKVLKKFEKDVMAPLEWGIELSEDSENLTTKTIVKNERGQYVYLEDELENDKKLDMTNKVIHHVHRKELEV